MHPGSETLFRILKGVCSRSFLELGITDETWKTHSPVRQDRRRMPANASECQRMPANATQKGPQMPGKCHPKKSSGVRFRKAQAILLGETWATGASGRPRCLLGGHARRSSQIVPEFRPRLIQTGAKLGTICSWGLEYKGHAWMSFIYTGRAAGPWLLQPRAGRGLTSPKRLFFFGGMSEALPREA